MSHQTIQRRLGFLWWCLRWLPDYPRAPVNRQIESGQKLLDLIGKISRDLVPHAEAAE